MEKRKLTKSKVEGSPVKKNRNAKCTVIIKTTKTDYIPSSVTLRSKINSYMITADATSAAIKILEKDPNVSSVSISQPIKGVE